MEVVRGRLAGERPLEQLVEPRRAHLRRERGVLDPRERLHRGEERQAVERTRAGAPPWWPGRGAAPPPATPRAGSAASARARPPRRAARTSSRRARRARRSAPRRTRTRRVRRRPDARGGSPRCGGRGRRAREGARPRGPRRGSGAGRSSTGRGPSRGAPGPPRRTPRTRTARGRRRGWSGTARAGAQLPPVGKGRPPATDDLLLPDVAEQAARLVEVPRLAEAAPREDEGERRVLVGVGRGVPVEDPVLPLPREEPVLAHLEVLLRPAPDLVERGPVVRPDRAEHRVRLPLGGRDPALVEGDDAPVLDVGVPVEAPERGQLVPLARERVRRASRRAVRRRRGAPPGRTARSRAAGRMRGEGGGAGGAPVAPRGGAGHPAAAPGSRPTRARRAVRTCALSRTPLPRSLR